MRRVCSFGLAVSFTLTGMLSAAVAQQAPQVPTLPLLPGGTVQPQPTSAPVAAPAPAVAPPAPSAASAPVVPLVENAAKKLLAPISANTTNSTGAAEEVAAAPTAPAAEAPSEKSYSYGSFPVSIMFTAGQMNDMKQALQIGETLPAAAAGAVQPKATVAAVTAVPVTEPTSYPVFYLSSIAYRAPGDWALWISGHKITPVKNDTDVKVTAVSATQASFTWIPVFQQAMANRRSQKAFADTTKLKNRLASDGSVQFDDATGTATFTLRTNQTFVPGYMAVFEGYVESPTLPPLVVAAGGKEAAHGGGALAQDAINTMLIQANKEAAPPGNEVLQRSADDGVKAIRQRLSGKQ